MQEITASRCQRRRPFSVFATVIFRSKSFQWTSWITHSLIQMRCITCIRNMLIVVLRKFIEWENLQLSVVWCLLFVKYPWEFIWPWSAHFHLFHSFIHSAICFGLFFLFICSWNYLMPRNAFSFQKKKKKKIGVFFFLLF